MQRLIKLVCEGNISALNHHLKLLLGLRGPVPEPAMPDPVRRVFRGRGFFRSSEPLEILFVSHDLNLEGASLSLFELVSGLRKRADIHPRLAAFEDGPLRRHYEESGMPVKILECGWDRLSSINRLERVTAEIAGWIVSQNSAAVFANTLRTFPAILAAEKAGLASIWNVRESARWDIFFSKLPDPVAMCAIQAASLPYRMIFVSEASRKIWKCFDRYRNFEVISNSIDPGRFHEIESVSIRESTRKSLGIGEEFRIILNVGTINERKGQRDLVEATALLSNDARDQIHVVMVGDDRDLYARRLRARCVKLPARVRDRIHWVASTDSIGQFYAAADLFVFCSKEESAPRVILEAMAFGLPVISTPVHGVTEQITDNQQALFYDRGNPAMLAHYLETLIRDKMLSAKMSRASRARMHELQTFDQMVDAYRSACLQAAASRPTPQSLLF